MQHQLTRTRRSGVFAARRRARGLRLDNLGLGIPGPCGAKPMSYAWGAHLSLAAPLGLEFDVAPIAGAPTVRPCGLPSGRNGRIVLSPATGLVRP